MKTGILSMLVFGLLGFGFGMADVTDSMAEKEVSPAIKEILPKDTITGTLMRKEGEYYFIQDNNNEVQRIHVDKSTKLDKVIAGDKVKASVTAQGHTTTLQHVSKP